MKRGRSKSESHTPGKRRKGENGLLVVDTVRQEEEVTAYMFHAIKLLNKAIKQVVGVEVLKLNKKIISLQAVEVKEEKEIHDLQQIHDSLKSFDTTTIPLELLHNRLKALPYLHPILPKLVASLPILPAPVDSKLTSIPQSNARNRILGNKLIKSSWEEVVRAIAKRMGQVVKPKPVIVKKVVPVAKIIAPESESELEEGAKQLSKRAHRAAVGEAKAKGLPPPKPLKKIPKKLQSKASLPMELNDSESEPEEGMEDDLEIGSEDEDEVEREMARLNGETNYSDVSDEEGSDAFFASNDEGEAAPQMKEKVTKPTVTKPKREKSKSTISSSTFLPSLAGGYISYSDSDGEEARWVKEGEKDTEKKERKNRRGQRARQAIWEQKYGSGANHVVKTEGGQAAKVTGSKSNKNSSKTKSSVKKSSSTTGVPQAGDRHAPFNPSQTRAGAEFNPNTQPIQARSLPIKVTQGGMETLVQKVVSGETEKVHPSWEAAKRKAEAIKSLENAPKGKKITFD